MTSLCISLFGQFRIERHGEDLTRQYTRRMQELLCYLVLHRNRPLPRETLAGLLCGDMPGSQCKKSFRQTLWQVQKALMVHLPVTDHCLDADVDWIQFKTVSGINLDVVTFEHAFEQARGVPAQNLNEVTVQALRVAVQLYQGDLLEGWYHDWCLYERERLQQMQLVMLDKLTGYCESCGKYETGLDYGTQIMRFDRAREHTHRQLMRLYYLADDRSGALRQYERCVAALRDELQVRPSQSTRLLYEQIKADQLHLQAPGTYEAKSANHVPSSVLHAALVQMHHLQTALAELQRQVQEQIQTLEIHLRVEP